MSTGFLGPCSFGGGATSFALDFSLISGSGTDDVIVSPILKPGNWSFIATVTGYADHGAGLYNGMAWIGRYDIVGPPWVFDAAIFGFPCGDSDVGPWHPDAFIPSGDTLGTDDCGAVNPATFNFPGFICAACPGLEYPVAFGLGRLTPAFFDLSAHLEGTWVS